MSVKGQGSSETGANYQRALELCELVGGTSARFDALWGLWVFHLSRAELGRAAELAQQLLASASKDDSRHQAHANFVAGDTAFWRGQFETAAKHLALAIAAARPENRPSRATVEDAAMYSRAYAAWTEHYLGHPDQALTTIRECTRVARMLPHPGALAVANVFAAHLHLLRGEADAAAECCRTSISLADECGLAFYSIFAHLLAGCVAVQHGEREEGVEAIKRGIAAWRNIGSANSVPWFLGELGEGLRSLGHWDEASNIVRDALHQAQESGQLQFAAELHRIRGMVLVAQGEFLEAESSFRSAMEMARKQGARMWELRGTTSLARLLRDTNRRDEARTMLAGIYDWFTEGFDTADLKEAKKLLEELAPLRWTGNESHYGCYPVLAGAAYRRCVWSGKDQRQLSSRASLQRRHH
jgi:tetratricopeptide (TPR) repeat protein